MEQKRNDMMAKLKEIGLKVLVEIARVILGLTFMLSGFTKGVDPYGTAYKIEDYLAAFNLSSFSSLALFLSILLCLAEFLMGAFMLFGIYRRWNSRLVLITMLFMTPFTLYLAIADPVDDCGCFGDALLISNWATFYKNLVLLACAILVLIYCEKISNLFTGKTYWIAFLFTIAISIFFVLQNCLLEPIFDFRPYHIGANIPEKMELRPDQERIEETILIYKKDEIQKEFSDQNAPWNDESWEYVDMYSKVISEGELPDIQDFSISHLVFDKEREGLDYIDDITEQVLQDSSYSFLMIAPSLSHMSINNLGDFEDVAEYAREHRYEFYCLTASGPDEVLEWKNKHTINFEFANTDERALKTILRSNPGLILLKNGRVINKWADVEIPSEESLYAPIDELSIGHGIDTKEKDKQNLIYITALFIVPLLLLKFFDFITYGIHKVEEEKKEKTSEKEIT